MWNFAARWKDATLTLCKSSVDCIWSVAVCEMSELSESFLATDVMVQVTRADVDVQPYAFTTKSLFVGHLDYRYIRWQVSVFRY